MHVMDKYPIEKHQQDSDVCNQEEIHVSPVITSNELTGRQSPDKNKNLCRKRAMESPKNSTDSPRIKKFALHSVESHFLDLPPEMFEKVFSYLPTNDVYCNVRKVCHKLRSVADSYVQRNCK